MALNFGWKARETRESIWIDDPALAGVTEAARASWVEDGDAEHLRPFATNGRASIITFRSLDIDEHRAVTAALDHEDFAASYMRALVLCFRIGVDFKDLPTEMEIPGTGEKQARIVKDRGMRMLAKPFVDALERQYPGIVTFYGAKVFGATFPSEAEKKASSPPSTPTQSASGTGDRSPAVAGDAPSA